MYRFLTLLVGALTTICAMVASAASAAEQPTAAHPVLLRISHKLPPISGIAAQITAWADAVEKNSGYRIVVKQYGDNSLFLDDMNDSAAPPLEKSNYYNVKIGRIEAAVSEDVYWFDLTKTAPEMAFGLRPFAMPTVQSLLDFPKSDAAGLINRALEAKGVHNLGWIFPSSPAAFLTNKHAVLRLDDFKGMRIRTVGWGMNEPLAALGAVPVKLAGADAIINALHTNQLDGMYSGSVPNIIARHLDNEAKFVTLVPYVDQYFHLYVNPKWWSELPADLQKVVEDATADMERSTIETGQKKIDEALAKMRSDGKVTVASTSAEEIAQMRPIAQHAFDDLYLQATGAQGAEILRAMNKLTPQ